MENIMVSIAKDFSKIPGPRFKDEGSFSGEEFRETILNQKFLEALKNKVRLIIDLDGTMGYGTSFLEEVFGGLARAHGAENVSSVLEIKSDEEQYLKKDIDGYIEDTKKQGDKVATH